MVAVLFAFLVLGVLFTLLLYVAIESETTNTQILDRETAEKEAKRRGGIDPERQFGRRNDQETNRAAPSERDDGWNNSTGRPEDPGESARRDDWGNSTKRDDDW